MSNLPKFPWNDILVKYFTTVQCVDTKIEVIRQELCSNLSFIPEALYSILDLDNKAFLSLNDFKEFLTFNQVKYAEESLRRLIHNFDKDNDFSLNYNEFLDIVLPKENDTLRAETANRKSNNDDDVNGIKLDKVIVQYFINILQMELNLIEKLVIIAEELKYSKEFTTYEAYLTIVHEDKYITVDNLEAFLKENEVILEGNDLSTLLFRIDSDADGKISYEEFLEIFFPFKRFDYYKEERNKGQNKGECETKQMKRLEASQLSMMEETMDEKSLLSDRQNKYKHGYSRYEDKTNNIMTDNNHNDKKMVYEYNDGSHRSPKKATSSKEYNNSGSKYNYDINDVNDNNGMLSSDRNNNLKTYITPSRDKLNQSQNNYQKEYGLTMPDLSSSMTKNHDKDNTKNGYKTTRELSPLEFNRKRTRIQLRTQAKVKSIPNLQHKFNQENFLENSNNNDSTCNNCSCNMINSCCNCCSNRLCCRIDKQKRTNIFNLLNDFLLYDTKIEELKEQLILCQDSNLPDLFKFFDISNNEMISQRDMCECLQNLGLSLSSDDISILYKTFDKDFDGFLNYEEFCEMILPKKYEEAQVLNNRQPATYFYEFDFDTLNILTDLFAVVIEAEKSHEKLKVILLSSSSILESFDKLKKSTSDGIEQDDENGVILNKYEVELLIDRFDKNQDGIISYNEFIDEMEQ